MVNVLRMKTAPDNMSTKADSALASSSTDSVLLLKHTGFLCATLVKTPVGA